MMNMKITPEQKRRAALYPKSVRWSEPDQCFIGRIDGLAGDCHHGDDPKEVFRTLLKLAEETVTEWDAQSLTLPKPPKKLAKVKAGPVNPKAIREKLGMSQSRFADFLSISVKTLHKWEQQTAAPSGPARGLLRIAAAHPEVVRETLG